MKSRKILFSLLSFITIPLVVLGWWDGKMSK